MRRGEVWWVNFDPSVGGEIRKKDRGAAERKRKCDGPRKREPSCTWFKVCSGPIYHGLSTPDDRCVGRHGTPSTRTHRPASAGAAGGHHKAPGWGGLSSRPKKARICRQSSSFARRQLSRGPPRRGCRTAEVRLPRSSVTAGLRALAPPPKPSTASGRASAVQRSVLNSAVQASLE